MSSMTQKPSVSVVVPTLNAARVLPETIAMLRAGATGVDLAEIIVVDGGSRDDTAARARALGADVLEGARGRGQQLAQGAGEARSDWLLFLHADTRLSDGWGAASAQFIDAQECKSQPVAAVFRFVLDDGDRRARLIERLARWRARLFALPYGDQGLLIDRGFYHDLGGFRALALMEDVDMVRRIGRSRLVELPCDAVTSAARYRRDGWYRRPFRNLIVLTLYFLGMPNNLLRRIYG